MATSPVSGSSTTSRRRASHDRKDTPTTAAERTDQSPPPAEASPRPRRRGCRSGCLGSLLLFLIAVLIATLVGTNKIANQLVATFKPALERETGLAIAYKEMQVLGRNLLFHEVVLTDSATGTEYATIRELRVVLRPKAFYRRDPYTDKTEYATLIQEIAITDPVVKIHRTAKGFDLTDLLGTRPTKGDMPILNVQLKLKGGRLEYTDYPVNSDGSRDFDSPLPVTVAVDAEALMRRGVIVNAWVKIADPATASKPLVLVTGGGKPREALEMLVGVDGDVGALLGEGGLFHPIVPALGEDIEGQIARLTTGTLKGQVAVVLKAASDDPLTTANEREGLGLTSYLGDLTLSDFTLAIPEIASDPLKGEATLSMQPEGARLSLARATLGEALVSAQGEVGWETEGPRANLQVVADNLDLSRLPVLPLPMRDTLGYEGAVRAQGSLVGTVEDYAFTAQLSGPSVRLAGQPFVLQPSPVTLRDGILQVQATLTNGTQRLDVAGTSELAARESGFHLEVQEIPAALIKRALPAFAELPLEGPVSGAAVLVSDPVNHTRADIDLVSTNGLFADLPYGTILGRLHYSAAGLEVRRLVGTLPGGKTGALIAHGRYGTDGSLALDAQVGGIEVDSLVPGESFSGELFGQVQLRGTAKAPLGTFDVQLVGGQLGGIPYAQLASRGALTATGLTLETLTVEADAGHVAIEGAVALGDSEQVHLTGEIVQRLPRDSETEALAPTGLITTFSLAGSLSHLTLDAEVAGQATVGGTRLSVEADAPAHLSVDGLGLEFRETPRTWASLLAMLKSGTPPTVAGPVRFTHEATLEASPVRAAGRTFDPYFAAELRRAAPALADLILEREEGPWVGPAIEGTLVARGEWQYSDGEVTGQSAVVGAELTTGSATFLSNTLLISRAASEPVRIKVSSTTREGGGLTLDGTIEPVTPLMASVLDLELSLTDYPLEPLLALSAAPQGLGISGELSGGGTIGGTLGTPRTIATEGGPPGLRFTVAEAALGTLRPIGGEIVLAYGGGELSVSRLNLDGPEGFHAGGSGRIYLSREELDRSLGSLFFTAVPLSVVVPVLAPSAPPVSGTLDFATSLAFTGGVPTIQATVKMTNPAMGAVSLDRIEAVLNYNPITDTISIDSRAPLALIIGEHRLEATGEITLPEDKQPQLNLLLDTTGIPLSAVIAPTETFSANGGLEEVTLWVTGSLFQPELQGDVRVVLTDIRMLDQPVLAEAGGWIHFERRRTQEGGTDLILGSGSADEQFSLTNTEGVRTGKVHVKGVVDFTRLALGTHGGRDEAIGTLTLVPETPATILPLTGFGLSSGLKFTDAQGTSVGRPLTVTLGEEGIELVGDLMIAQGQLDLRKVPSLGTGPGEIAPGPVVPLPLDFNLSAHIPAGFQIIGPSDLKMELDAGTLSLAGNPLAPTVSGIITARTGGFSVLGKKFTLAEPATLSFGSIYGLNPFINAIASTEVEVPGTTALLNSRTIEITVRVAARLQELGDESSPGLTFGSNDPRYQDPSAILALLVGFGGESVTTGGSTPLTDQFVKGLTNAAVSVPGQFVGRFFEEQGFSRFLIGIDRDNDVVLDMEYEPIEHWAVDYSQRFKALPTWEAGVKYEFRNNSFVRLGTTEQWDLIGTLEYRLPLGRGDSRASRAEIEEYEALREGARLQEEIEAKTLPEGVDLLDADNDIEAVEGTRPIVELPPEDEEEEADEEE